MHQSGADVPVGFQEDKGGEGKNGARGILTPTLRGSSECFSFCMCNPPFFESMREANANPHTACGGESGFQQKHMSLKCSNRLCVQQPSSNFGLRGTEVLDTDPQG